MRDEEEECAKEVCSLTMTADNCFFTVFMFIKLDCTRLIQESQCACTVLYPCTCEHMITTTESAVLLHAWVLTIRLYSIGAHFLWDCFCAETQQSRTENTTIISLAASKCRCGFLNLKDLLHLCGCKL